MMSKPLRPSIEPMPKKQWPSCYTRMGCYRPKRSTAALWLSISMIAIGVAMLLEVVR